VAVYPVLGKAGLVLLGALVDLQLRVWIRDARKRMDTISYITDKVKEAFDTEGIEIPYPKRDITIVQKT